MGYDLNAKNQELESFHFGAFSWVWLLDSGVGLAINTGPGLSSLNYFYQPDENGHSPQSNDGYHVPEDKAKMMAHLSRAVVSLQRDRRKAFDAKTLEEQKMMERIGNFNIPVRDDFVEKAEKFADWADKSGGFTIH